jgi:hypothetical protein
MKWARDLTSLKPGSPNNQGARVNSPSALDAVSPQVIPYN